MLSAHYRLQKVNGARHVERQRAVLRHQELQVAVQCLVRLPPELPQLVRRIRGFHQHLA